MYACIHNHYIQCYVHTDFLAYSSVFAGYGNGGGGEDYIGNSRKQVQRAISAMKEVLEVIDEK